MSETEVEQSYALETPTGEKIENKSEFSGIAIEKFPGGEKYEGMFQLGVNLTSYYNSMHIHFYTHLYLCF